MFGSSCIALVQAPGSVRAIGASAIGHSPPASSDCVLDRYGQNATESEPEMPAGQFGSATGPPLTGFSGIGGLNVVADGAAVEGQTAGPGVGSVTVPVRRPHQSFCACTGVEVLLVTPFAPAFSTPNALSTMLLVVIAEAAAPTRRTPAPRRRLPLFSAWLPSGYGSLFGVGEKTLAIGAPWPWTRFDEMVSSLICTEAPAVTRTPSWPNSGPVVSGSGGGIAGEPLEAWQSPTITGGVPALKSL